MCKLQRGELLAQEIGYHREGVVLFSLAVQLCGIFISLVYKICEHQRINILSYAHVRQNKTRRSLS